MQADVKFNPQELQCANCASVDSKSCRVHKKDFIDFKCRFCCNIATFKCWGTTSFCTPCHEMQEKGRRVRSRLCAADA